MSQKGFSLNIALVILAFIIGGFLLITKTNLVQLLPITQNLPFIPKSTPTPEKPEPTPFTYPDSYKINKKPKLEQTANWQTYKNDQFGFELKYPADWVVKTGSQSFNGKNMVNISSPETVGKHGEPSAVATMDSPIRTDKALTEWLIDYFGDFKYLELSEENVNGQVFQKIFNCGQGCFTRYFIKRGDYIFSLILIDSSSDDDNFKVKNMQTLANILATFKFTQ